MLTHYLTMALVAADAVDDYLPMLFDYLAQRKG